MRTNRQTRTQRFLVALVLAATAVPIQAQTPFGTVFGSVVDEKSHPLPGASVELSGVGAPQVAVTNDSGKYRFLNLDPGAYRIEARLDGYSTVEQPSVTVAVNRGVTVDFTLNSAIEERVTVTAEAPLLNERELRPGTVISPVELESLPLTREIWGAALLAPKVQLARVNVGGSDTGSQAAIFGPATTPSDNDYLIDGIQITSMSILPAMMSDLDFEQFQSIEVATGGPDVTKNTSGVALNMVTRRGTNEFRGTARFLNARDDGLGFLGNSSSDFSCADLHPDQDCGSFSTNRVSNITEYGFQAGGPAITDRLWLWGSWGVNQFAQTRASGSESAGQAENTSVKINAQISRANAMVASWNNGSRIDNAGELEARAPESVWDLEAGPVAFWRLEDSHLFGSDLFMTGSLQKSDAGWGVTPRSGCLDASCSLEQETLIDSDGFTKQNFLNGWQRNPETGIKLDASYFFDSGDTSHELKFGGRIRQSVTQENFNWPGRNIAHIASENFTGSPGSFDFFFLHRGQNALEIEVEYNSLWVQDTIAAGAWTINAGLRWDLQDGVNRPGTTGESALPEILPEVTFTSPVDAGFDWESITPRLGVTYALGEDRDTLLRTSFAQFPSQLGSQDVAWLNPAAPGGYGAYAYFTFFDGDGDNQWNGEEPYFFLFGDGYDEKNPTSNLNTVDPALDPEITTEWILGVEHAFFPELVAGLSYTGRHVDDIFDRRSFRPIVRPAGSSGLGRPATAADFIPNGTVSGTLANGTDLEAEAFVLDPSLEDTFFGHRENDARSRDYNGIALTLNKRLADHWSLRGYVNWGETEWNVPQSYLDNTDPNPDPEGGDQDGALHVVREFTATGTRFVQSGWQANVAGMVQLAPDRSWGFLLAGNFHARQGHVLPYDTRDPSAGLQQTVSLMNGEMDRFRMDDLYLLDLRAEKTFAADGNVNLTVGVDLFNVFNQGTVLSRQSTLSSSQGDYVLDIVSPRIWKLGVRVSWR